MRILSRYFLTGLLVLLPTWATFLILSALLSAVNRAIANMLGQVGVIATPFIGVSALRPSGPGSRRVWYAPAGESHHCLD